MKPLEVGDVRNNDLNTNSVPALSKALNKITESAPVLEPTNYSSDARKLKEVKSQSNEQHLSSNSLKPVMRGQLFRKQSKKTIN